MAIQRQVKKSNPSPGRTRYRIIITGDECPPLPTYEARFHQSLFLRWLADNQNLLECGYSVPERISITHNGTCWQAEAEAEVEETT